MEYSLTLKGVTPLLMHAANIDELDALEKWRKDPRNKGGRKGDDRNPAWTWQCYLTHDGDHIAIPAEYLSRVLRNGGVNMVMSGKKTFKSLSQSGVFIKDPFSVLLVNGKQIAMDDVLSWKNLPFDEQRKNAKEAGFDLWPKMVRVGQAKHVRIRPRFANWEIRSRFVVRNEKLTLDVLQQMWSLAGEGGIGDWTPSAASAPGSFGIFSATVALID